MKKIIITTMALKCLKKILSNTLTKLSVLKKYIFMILVLKKNNNLIFINFAIGLTVTCGILK